MKFCYAEQQYHVVPIHIGWVGSELGLGQRASWAVHGVGAWCRSWVHGVVRLFGVGDCMCMKTSEIFHKTIQEEPC